MVSMTPIFLKHRRRRPIYGTLRISKSNPLAQGLAFAFGSDSGLTDAVQTTAGVPSGSNKPTLIGVERGLATRFAGGASSVAWLSYGAHKGTENLGSGPATWAFRWRQANLGASSSGLAARNDNNAAGGAGWFVSIGTTYLPNFLVERATANMRVTGPAVAHDGFLHTLVVTSPGDLVAANVKFYNDSVLGATTVSAAGSGATGNDSAQNLEIGRTTFTVSGSCNGEIQVAIIARRVWNQAEVTAFHVNPWQIWEQDEITVYEPGGALLADQYALAAQAGTLGTGINLSADEYARAMQGAQLAAAGGAAQFRPWIVT